MRCRVLVLALTGAVIARSQHQSHQPHLLVERPGKPILRYHYHIFVTATTVLHNLSGGKIPLAVNLQHWDPAPCATFDDDSDFAEGTIGWFAVPCVRGVIGNL